ncbi:TonB-dependent receptor [Calditrichota bacterium]
MKIQSNPLFYFLLMSFFFFLFSYSPFAQQSVKLHGKIYDDQTGDSLVGANILLEELDKGLSSDTNGEFSFENVESGKYTISVSYVGYKLKKISILVSADRDMFVPINLIPEILEGQTIIVTSTRAVEGESPVAFSNISKQQLEETYTASDIPMLLNEVPGVYSYSLTGDNLGYSFLKIRGFDQRRIGVMINDIPLNDPEDQEVYWVDLPDMAESTQDIQIQRGVGGSIYGTSTFGGSVNIKTSNYSAEKSAILTFGGGSFNTRKAIAEFNSGIIKNTYAFSGRFSKITSNGYRRHSSSELQSFFLGFERYDKDFTTKLNIISGEEITHPDWDGIPESILKTDRRYKLESYENAVDNFTQSQYQLINDWAISHRMNFSNTFYYIRGEGYYENLKEGKKLTEFGMRAFETSDPGFFGSDSLAYYETDNDTLVLSNNKYVLKRTDLVRQKWVEKNQYGWITRVSYDAGNGMATFGSSVYLFDSNHYGKVLWAKHLPSQYSPDRKYYHYNGDKLSVSLYFNYIYDVFENAKLMTNILYENKSYKFKQLPTALFNKEELNRFNVEYNFFSPRLGLNYTLSPNFSVYGNLSFAQREPADNELWDDFTGPDDYGVDPLFERRELKITNGDTSYTEWSGPMIEPETVLDYEAGINYRSEKKTASLNLYYMDFRNEIVPLGSIHNDGYPVKGNAEQTVHMGAEFSIKYKPAEFLSLSGNFSYSHNFFENFIQREIIDWDTYDYTNKDLSGNSIAGFPKFLGNFRVSTYWKNLSASVLFRYVGKQYLDNTEDENRIVDSHNLSDLSLSYRLKEFLYFPELRFILKVNNLFDVQHETAGYYYYENYYYPGAERNIYFGITFNL